jgi:hypothetical protein
MAVRVQFPDGSTREVPSYTVEVPSREIPPGPSTFIEKPLPDPDWDYTATIGDWIAQPKRP